MAFVKKIWKNRIAEYINRRLITMEDGSTNLVTVARDEGTISQEGDAFNAVNMNDLEDRIEAGFADVTQSLTNINTYVGKDKKLHFVDSSGADTVLPFNSYDDGRIQGRNDVIGSPNYYGLYTKAQYDANKVTYKSGNYNTGLNGETWRSTSFNTGFSTIIALQINCWNDEGNGYFNAFKNVRISGGKVSLDFYAADYVDNYVQWLAVGK